MDHTALYVSQSWFGFVRRRKRASPITTETGNLSIYLGMFSERGLKCSLLFSIYFWIGLLLAHLDNCDFGIISR